MSKVFAKKSFGQNFLRDEGVISHIVSEISPKPGENLVEIGPGLGALTEPVADLTDHITVIELDRELAEKLRHHPFIHEKLDVVEEDALRAVAQKAIERKTGARSLKGIIEDVMLDVMYEIPKSDEKRTVIITKECITDGAKPKVEAAS